MSSTEHSQSENGDSLERLKLRILSAAGLLLPLLASVPPLTAWGALMTVPFMTYLLLMIGNLGSTILGPLDIFNIIGYSIGIILLLYSIAYLWKRKAKGLVTTGPYCIVRHPQYFSITVFTAVATYQSVWILQHTFGIGWLNIDQTLALWIAMLITYAAIGAVEELHLQKVYGLEWIEYANKVGFLLPLVKSQSRVVEAAVCVIIPVAVLYASLYLTA